MYLLLLRVSVCILMWNNIGACHFVTYAHCVLLHYNNRVQLI